MRNKDRSTGHKDVAHDASQDYVQSFSKEDCIAEFKRLQDEIAPKRLTRDLFRAKAIVSEATYERHFGTFAEFRRQAGLMPTRQQVQIANKTARHASVDHYRKASSERQGWAESYARPSGKRFQTGVFASDLHDKEIDPFFNRVLQDTVKRIQPDVISLVGDVFDLPEFGKYTVDPRDWDAVGRIKFAHENIFKPLREAAPDAQFDLIEGNHECVSLDTEILTDRGWVTAANITPESKVASFPIGGNSIDYDIPVALGRDYDRDMVLVYGPMTNECVTTNHRLLVDGRLQYASELIGETIDTKRLTKSLAIGDEAEPLSPCYLELLGFWAFLGGNFRHLPSGPAITFGRADARKISRLKALATRAGFKFDADTHRATFTLRGPNVEALARRFNLDTPTRGMARRLPAAFNDLGAWAGPTFAKEIARITDLSSADRTIFYADFGHDLGDDLQLFFTLRGIPAKLTKIAADQFSLAIALSGMPTRGVWTRVKPLPEKQTVVSIQTNHGTLVTRRDGKINFTGNCRLLKHLSDVSPATRSVLSDLHGMTMRELLGLDKFEVNYIAKANLASYTQREHQKELTNNYKVYWNCFLAHHFPHARNMGLPGVNGHHHSHQVWSMFNLAQGAYEWHQMGAGHRRSASYCEGERWHNGFAIVHVDTHTRQALIEYVPIGEFAVVGGKFYTREASELLVTK